MSAQLPAPLSDVPMSLLDVAETFGFPLVFTLMEHFGGQEIKFPKDPAPDHKVLKALGAEDGRKVCFFLTGRTIYIPHGRQKITRRVIADLTAKGHNRTDIAALLGLSVRHVRRVANAGERIDPNQLSLGFDD